MKTDTPQTIYLKDYRQPPYRILETALTFHLGDDETLVQGRFQVERTSDELAGEPLELDGAELELRSIHIDGEDVDHARLTFGPETLTVADVPAKFELTTTVAINPEKNTSLEGLYRSSTMFCTQCEAQGFRKITYYIDRPDNLARFTTTIIADDKKFPIALSNGNHVSTRKLENGLTETVWEDPFLKPSYLFALVAGDLECVDDTYTTQSGRVVALKIYVEKQNVDKCDHAMLSLKQAMAWDEERFGLEYDLDIYMIVAVNDFNFGAMENKGLNIFNSKYVLARIDTATDTDFEGIQGVVGHEYFHNWTGNRVTCRDWFQLSLKEGLTVFRDQEFSADLNSRAIKRIDDVNQLRTFQFPEDAGPMSHPIRPSSYIEINNFYTVTIYEKGAEVIRMLHTILGETGFQKGVKLYFERHDGQAATTDDWLNAMEDANDVKLTQFQNWYKQSGTPEVFAHWTRSQDDKTWSLTLRQSCPATPGQQEKDNFVIPVRFALFDLAGTKVDLSIDGRPLGTETTLMLTQEEQTWVFENVSSNVTPSILRDFSAPIRLDAPWAGQDLAHLVAYDDDGFSCWEAAQTLMRRSILNRVANPTSNILDETLANALEKLLKKELDPALRAAVVTLPSITILGDQMEVIDIDALRESRRAMRKALASRLKATFEKLYESHFSTAEYEFKASEVARRRLANTALSYLVASGDPKWTEQASTQIKTASNMTDVMAAMKALALTGSKAFETELKDFYSKWESDQLVIDKWFGLQATADTDDVLERVNALRQHPAFNRRNPNRVRSLLSALTLMNPAAFHDKSGKGYAIIADEVLALNEINPQVAARLVRAFLSWQRYDAGRQALIKENLERIVAAPNLSKDVYEVASKSLAAN